jgi:hypothetical protein
MADIVLTTTPQKIADDGDEFLLSFPSTARANVVNVVTTATENVFTDRSVHEIRPNKNEAMGRGQIGAGYVYAYVQSEHARVTAKVTTWTA